MRSVIRKCVIACSLYVVFQETLKQKKSYSRINSKKSPPANAGNVSEPRMTSHSGRVSEAVYA